MIYSVHPERQSAENVSIDAAKFTGYFNCWRCQEKIVSRFKMQFGSVEIIETHGIEYFKVRIPKDTLSLGFMYGFVESNMQDSWGVKEYSISQTTLEMIFNKFAEESQE